MRSSSSSSRPFPRELDCELVRDVEPAERVGRVRIGGRDGLDRRADARVERLEAKARQSQPATSPAAASASCSSASPGCDTRQRAAARRAALLHDVGELVCQQLLPVARAGAVLALREVDVGARREGAGRDRARQARSAWSSVWTRTSSSESPSAPPIFSREESIELLAAAARLRYRGLDVGVGAAVGQDARALPRERGEGLVADRRGEPLRVGGRRRASFRDSGPVGAAAAGLVLELERHQALDRTSRRIEAQWTKGPGATIARGSCGSGGGSRRRASRRAAVRDALATEVATGRDSAELPLYLHLLEGGGERRDADQALPARPRGLGRRRRGRARRSTARAARDDGRARAPRRRGRRR